MKVSFVGHRDAPDSLKEKLRSVIEELIVNQGATTFLFGNQGAFDRLVYRVLKELKQYYPNIKIFAVLAYMPTKESQALEDSVFPAELATVPKKLAILKRNQWMIQQSRILVSYVTCSVGGAATAKSFAKRRGIEIIELSNYQNLGKA